MLEAVLVLNLIWFSMAFNVFAIRHEVFAKLVVPRDQRDTPVFNILAESGRFLGGMNFAFALCNLLVLLNLSVFPTETQRAILLLVFGVAHATQFIFNVPVALENKRTGGGVWQVKGTMLFIFVTDFLMMALNLFVAVLLVF